MTIRRLGSIFRRPMPVGRAVMDDNRKLIEDIDRRGLLRGSLSLGSLVMLTGCDAGHEGSVQTALRAVSKFNDAVQAALFRPNHLAPTYPVDRVAKPPRFNAYYPRDEVRPVAAATWKLELAGRVGDRTPWTVDRIWSEPHEEIVVKHICVEGWDYVGQWAGMPMRRFLERIGADTRARYVAFRCADDYTGSIDMATALHPQTLLATHYAGRPLEDPFGFPLRLRTATKLGYKNPKWITAIEVTNEKPGGYWEDRGFNWFGGI